MLYTSNKKPTHIVMIGFFENEYSWKTEFCVPFFCEEAAVKYRNETINNKESKYIQAFILTYIE